jgi:localization factor PodJL
MRDALVQGFAAADTDRRPSMFFRSDPIASVPDTDEHRWMRAVLLGGIGVLVVAAFVSGIVLSRTFTASPLTPVPFNPRVMTPDPLKPATSVIPSQANTAQTNSVQAGFAISPFQPEPAIESAPLAAAPSSHKTYMPGTQIAAVPALLILPSKSAPRSAKVASMQIEPAIPLTARLAALATSGNAKAEVLLGLEYVDGDGEPVNEAEGAKWLERAAFQGEDVAAYRLGTLYERGQGVPADPAKAALWYAVAARAGNRKAMHNLAVAYAQGAGVQKDLPTAAQWFSRAAALGLADSQFNVAVLYERGMGVPQSLADAYKWYAIAAAQGDTESKTRLEALDSQISAGEKANAQKAAANFRPEPLNRTANSPPDTATALGG